MMPYLLCDINSIGAESEKKKLEQNYAKFLNTTFFAANCFYLSKLWYRHTHTLVPGVGC